MELLVEIRERVRADLRRIDDQRFTQFSEAVEGSIWFGVTNGEMRARFGPGGGKRELPCLGMARPNNDDCGFKYSSSTSGESFEKGFAVATGESDAG